MKFAVLFITIICLLSGCAAGKKKVLSRSATAIRAVPTGIIVIIRRRDEWVNILKTAERGRLTVINAGIGGQTTEDARLRFQSDVLDRKPQYLFIMFGTNDAGILTGDQPRVSKKRFKENLTYFINESRNHGIKPILMTCIPVIEGNGTHHLYYYSRYKASAFKEKAARENGIIPITALRGRLRLS